MTTSTEMFLRIYDDDHGYYWQIRPDTDGLDCIELFYSDGLQESKLQSLTTMSTEAARAMAKALLLLADDIDTRLTAMGEK